MHMWRCWVGHSISFSRQNLKNTRKDDIYYLINQPPCLRTAYIKKFDNKFRTISWLSFNVVYFFSDEFSDDLGRFFEELGSGSPEEVSDKSADDETADLQARRCRKLHKT